MRIKIPGDPIPQARHRSFLRGKKVIQYDPVAREKANTKLYLKGYLEEIYPGYEMPAYPIVSFIFYFSIPKSMPKHLKILAEAGLLKHENKPDYDNLEKFYLDCMSGLVFEDDRKASSGGALKLYHREPHTMIFVENSSQCVNKQLDDAQHFSGSCILKHDSKDFPHDLIALSQKDVQRSPVMNALGRGVESYIPE